MGSREGRAPKVGGCPARLLHRQGGKAGVQGPSQELPLAQLCHELFSLASLQPVPGPSTSPAPALQRLLLQLLWSGPRTLF